MDSELRLAAFNWLKEQTSIIGDVFPRELLEKGFIFKDKRIPLVSPKGIFKPKIADIPLTITTTTKGPYEDSFDKDGFLRYKYRGSDPDHSDNVGLREAYRQGKPLIYFHGVVPGKYLAVWPVFVIADDPKNLTFTVAVDDLSSLNSRDDTVQERTDARRAYITSTVRLRFHQRSFREKVLSAYHAQCALCRLKHLELLDAAHIIPDTEPQSVPTVPNGIALCKLHHAAFDSFFIGISPDYIIELREDILDEEDGPMLEHGLKGLHRTKIILPSSRSLWPERNFLDWRYQRFKKAI
jgi:putative restriction endonuclease